MKTTLDGWKRGDARDLRTCPRPITAQDLDWLAGGKLVAYEVEGEGKKLDANLRFPVKLSLRAATATGREDRQLPRRHQPIADVFRDFR